MNGFLQEDYFPQLLAKDFIPIISEIKDAHKKDTSTSDGMLSVENLNRIFKTARNTPGSAAKKIGVFINELLHIRKTPKNLALAEKTVACPSAENAAELMNHSDLMGSNSIQRKSKKARKQHFH